MKNLAILKRILQREFAQFPHFRELKTVNDCQQKITLKCSAIDLVSQKPFYNNYVDEHTLFLHELKYKIRQAIILGHFEIAHDLLENYKKKMDPESHLEQQFVLLNDILASPMSYSVRYRLAYFEDAIRLTCPNYAVFHLKQISQAAKSFLVLNQALVEITPDTCPRCSVQNPVFICTGGWYGEQPAQVLRQKVYLRPRAVVPQLPSA